MNKFYEFKAVAPAKGELYLYGEIASDAIWGDEVTAAQFQKDLSALGDITALDLHINSPGGNCFAGMAIYSILARNTAKKTVYIDGIAASMACIVAMVGDKIIIPKNATMMFHQSMAAPTGNKVKLRMIADALERVDSQQVDILAKKSGNKPEEIASMMEADHFMTGAEAVEQGFADELEEPRRLVACAGLEKFIAQHPNAPNLDIEPEEPQATANQGGFLLPVNGADNPQPVSDKPTDFIAEQRKHFTAIRKKIIGV